MFGSFFLHNTFLQNFSRLPVEGKKEIKTFFKEKN